MTSPEDEGMDRVSAALIHVLRWGALLLSLLLYIPYQMEDRYFCSHFVAEVLKRAQLIREDKASVLYLPKDFTKLPGAKMVFRGNLHDLSEAYGLA